MLTRKQACTQPHQGIHTDTIHEHGHRNGHGSIQTRMYEQVSQKDTRTIKCKMARKNTSGREPGSVLLQTLVAWCAAELDDSPAIKSITAAVSHSAFLADVLPLKEVLTAALQARTESKP